MAAAERSRGGSPRQGASRKTAAAPGPAVAWRWYGAGLLSGIFLSFMAYLVLLPPSPPERSREGSTAAVATAPQPRFDFFEMLPNQSMDLDIEPATEPPGGATEKAVYLLQAGSFRQAEDADRRRAELLLLGLEPRVEETNGANGRWFRVLLGPFETRSRMAAARSLTAQQSIDTLLVRRG